jgi:ribosomal protein L15E
MFEKTNGSRAEVWHGTAKKTSGGLTKSHLMMNKHGRIVSRRKHASGKKSIKHLVKLGYKAKKGHFTLFRKGHRGSRKMSRKMRGGVGAPMEMGMQGTPMGNAMAGKMMGGKRYSRKYMKGGMAYGGPLSPHSYDGRGVGTSGAGLQIMATTMS